MTKNRDHFVTDYPFFTVRTILACGVTDFRAGGVLFCYINSISMSGRAASVMNCGFCKVGNVVIDRKCVPLFLCSCVVYIGEFAAIRERRITNCGNTVRDCYVCETGAPGEHVSSNCGNTVRECYTNSKKEWCLC